MEREGVPELLPAACSRSSFEKNFCAWLRICTAVLVPMCSAVYWRLRQV